MGDLGAARQRLLDNGISPGDIATSCGIVGVTLGTAFQVTDLKFAPTSSQQGLCKAGSRGLERRAIHLSFSQNVICDLTLPADLVVLTCT